MRCFFALPLPEEARSEIIRDLAPARGKFPGLRWIPEESIHITLIFLGDLNQQEVNGCIDMLKAAAEVTGAFPLAMDRIGCFPPRGRPRVYVAHVSRGAEPCIRIHDFLKENLPAAGMAAAVSADLRPYAPHCTIARVRNDVALPGLEELGRPAWNTVIGRCVLYESVLRPSGPEYREIAEVRFR
ncbi:MAG: RNA 2',3'-cyclic phosphodiesterase [Spirochaetales bacterium]|nr:MAG: RNA 2',3'-cyclic phosphodiesterase [Spirochaetales bacterium]